MQPPEAQLKPATAAAGSKPRQGGITLIELLVVMSIIVVLTGLLMPMVGSAQRVAQRSRTEAVLRKVDGALRQYHAEFGVFPYQAVYPDLGDGETLASHPNSLAYHLGTEITDQDKQNVLADMDSAANAFCDENTGSPLRFTGADTNNPNLTVLVNRMARQRARLAVLAGDLQVSGPYFISQSTGRVVNRTTTMASLGNLSAGNPGWARDYLNGELESRYIDPVTKAIKDDYGTPLVYINQTLPGMTGSRDIINLQQVQAFEARGFGLGPQGFAANTGPAASLESAGRTYLLCSGRVRLSLTDAGDGQPTPVDGQFFPVAGDLMHSDVRYYAAPGFERDFELWSAGPDRQFAYMRDDPANADNISVTPYARGLQ